MKRTKRIISLIMSAQVVAMTGFASFAFSSQRLKSMNRGRVISSNQRQKQSALGSQNKTKLLRVGLTILTAGLPLSLTLYKMYDCDLIGIIKLFRYDVIISYFDLISGKERNTLEEFNQIYADMCYCHNRLCSEDQMELPADGRYPNIEKKYHNLQDPLDIVQEFLSHFETLQQYAKRFKKLDSKSTRKFSDEIENMNRIVEGLKSGSYKGFVYNRNCCIYAFDKSFEIGDQDLKTIIDKFYNKCSLIVHPDKHKFDGQEEKAKEIFQKLDEWKDTMDKILEN